MQKIWYGKWKWLKRVLVLVFLTGLLGTGILLGINWYIKSTAGERIGVEVKKADCILVLGAGLTAEGKPSLVLRDRLDRGIELYKKGISDRLLMSGDHGRKGYDEVRAMKQYAVDAGVDPEHIFMDHAGFSTYESIYRARDVFKVKRLVIVTQPYHAYRAVYIAMKLGLDAYGMPSKATQYRGSWILEAREKLARTKEFFNVMLEPEPAYLGEAVPITGSGSQTDDTEQTWQPAAASGEEGKAQSVEQQIDEIARAGKTWRLEYREKDDPNYYQGSGYYWYAVTDLDQNGRLELLSAVTNGNGYQFSCECHEVSPSGDSLSEIRIDPELDIAPISEVDVYRDKKGDSIHFVICNMDKGGAAYHELRWQDVVKAGDRITSSVYASYVDEDGKCTYYTGDFGKKISKKNYKQLLSERFAGMEKQTGHISWFQLKSGKPAAKLKKSYKGFRLD